MNSTPTPKLGFKDLAKQVHNDQQRSHEVNTPSNHTPSNHNLELWFIRHAFSCNNNVSKDNPLNFVLSSKIDPGIATAGIIDALLFDKTNFHLYRFQHQVLNVRVSTSIRTWETAAILFARDNEVNLIVTPGLNEKHGGIGAEYSFGNLPNTLQQQITTFELFLHQLHLIYRVDLKTINLTSHGNTARPHHTFFQKKSEKDRVKILQKELENKEVFEELSTRKEKINPTRYEYKIKNNNLEIKHSNNIVPDLQGIENQKKWSRSYSEYDSKLSIFRAMPLILSNDDNKFNALNVYFCVTHSRAMQRAIIPGYPTTLITEDSDRNDLEYDETNPTLTQTVIKNHNLWQIKCTGTRSKDTSNIKHVSIFPGFEKFTSGLGRRLDSNFECEKDLEALSHVFRRNLGMSSTSRMSEYRHPNHKTPYSPKKNLLRRMYSWSKGMFSRNPKGGNRKIRTYRRKRTRKL